MWLPRTKLKLCDTNFVGVQLCGLHVCNFFSYLSMDLILPVGESLFTVFATLVSDGTTKTLVLNIEMAQHD